MKNLLSRLSVILFSITLSQPAFAYPIVVGSISQSILLIVLAGAGASSYAVRRSKKLLAAVLVLSLAACAYTISTQMEVESLSLRAVGSFSYDFDKDKPLPKHIDMVQASDLIEAKGFVAIQVSDRPTPLIKGMNNFSSHHGSAVIQFAASQNGEGIV